MADARDRAEWNRTAWLLCYLLNAWRSDDDSPTLTPGDCNPYAIREDGGEENRRENRRGGVVIPYDPKVLIQIQENNRRLYNPEPPTTHG